MAGYAGYQGVGGYALDPEAERLRRRRSVAEALQANSMDASPTTAIGGISRIAEALAGAYAGKKADTADQAYSDKRKGVADALMNAALPQDAPAANPPNSSIAPSMADSSGGDPTDPSFESNLGASAQMPAAASNPDSKINNVARALYAYSGDPTAAIGYAQQQKAAQEPEYDFLTTNDGGVYRGDKRGGSLSTMSAPTKIEAPKPPTTTMDGTRQWNETTKQWEDIPGALDAYRKMHPENAGGDKAPSGFRFKRDGSLEPIPGGPADTSIAQFGDPSKTGDDYLQTLPPQIASQVKALSEGRLAMPSSFALKTPYWQGMLQATAQYDPSFDQANAGTRSQTRKDFTSGKSAQNITSFNTLLGHLETLKSAAADLKNGNFVPLNQAGNIYAKSTGDPRIDTFNSAKHAVIGELVRAFRGSAGNVHDIHEWEKAIDASSSPEQLNGVISQMVELLGSRIESLGNQYSAGMGRSVDGINLLDPKAQKSYYNILGVAPPESAVGGPQGGAGAPPPPPPAATRAPAQVQQRGPVPVMPPAGAPTNHNGPMGTYLPPPQAAQPAPQAVAQPQPAPQGGPVTVRAPDGSMHAFPNQQAADAFKQAAGIR